MLKSLRFGARIVLLAFAAAACKGTSDPEPPGPPAEIRAVTGAAGTVPIASASPAFTARVVDAKGKGVPNVTVVWSADEGTVSPSEAVTDANGNAQTTWGSGVRTGPRTIVATVTTAAGPRTASFAVTVAAPRALRFDGVDDYVQVPNSPTIAPGTSDFTWEIWLKRERTGRREDVMTRKDVFADSEHDVAIYIDEFDRVNAFARDHPNANTTIVTSIAPIGTDWTHLAIVRSGAAFHLYVNGALNRTGFASFILTTNGPLRIGANRANNAGPDAAPLFPFAGLVHEVRVWRSARTAGQIAEAARQCVARQQFGLIADYRFDEGTGTTVRDASGSGNDGTLRNGPTWVPGASRCA
ncbi:MAG TPA: LamG-like jellyroll fold domain-containing protein [Longimicrobium sp.]|jgi:hypothetical protein